MRFACLAAVARVATLSTLKFLSSLAPCAMAGAVVLLSCRCIVRLTIAAALEDNNLRPCLSRSTLRPFAAGVWL